MFKPINQIPVKLIHLVQPTWLVHPAKPAHPSPRLKVAAPPPPQAIKPTGFTIIELLIVVVVIAILATIAILTYNNIRQRANASSAQTLANQATKKVQLYHTTQGEYPANLSLAGITDTTNLQYTVNNTTNPQTYCLTATTGTTSYFTSSAQLTPQPGGCAGHGVGGVGAVTNHIRNPDLVSGGGNASLNYPTRASINRAGGVVSLVVSELVAGDKNGLSIDSTTPPGQYYAGKVRVRAIAAGGAGKTGNAILHDGTTRAASITFTLTTNWQEVTILPTQLNTGNVKMYVYFGGSGWAIGDGVEITKPFIQQVDAAGQAASMSFASGASPNWVWNGTPNNSTSTGPAQ